MLINLETNRYERQEGKNSQKNQCLGKIIIRLCDGERMERLFKDTAFFQVREMENT